MLGLIRDVEAVDMIETVCIRVNLHEQGISIRIDQGILTTQTSIMIHQPRCIEGPKLQNNCNN